MRYEFTKDLETGNLIIDKEHKELFAAVNEMLDACSQGRGRAQLDAATKFLMDYVNRHFSHEDDLQKKSAYPGFAAHHAFHEDYKRKLAELVSKMPKEGASFADLSAVNRHIGILVTHILLEDKKLGAYLKKQG